MNLRVLKLFCWINWPINSFCTMSFCLIFRLPSQILAFIRGLPDFFVFCFNRLPSVSINFYLSFCEKNLVLPCPSLLAISWRSFMLMANVMGSLQVATCFLIRLHIYLLALHINVCLVWRPAVLYRLRRQRHWAISQRKFHLSPPREKRTHINLR